MFVKLGEILVAVVDKTISLIVFFSEIDSILICLINVFCSGINTSQLMSFGHT